MGRRLGQHFLVSDSVLSRLAAAVCPEPAPLVVEIGPGKGALTRHLLERASQVVAIELDPALPPLLRQRFPSGSLEIIQGDVLETNLAQWGPVPIAGNLPYYITSPILAHVLALGPRFLKRAVLLMQREVAERVLAAPGSRDYGYLSVACQVRAEVEWLFRVPPGAFSPPPKVDSAALRFTPVDPSLRWAIPDVDRFLRFAAACFQQKRKTLRNNLRGAWPLIESHPAAGARAEELSIAQLVELHRELTANHPEGVRR